MNLVNKVAFLSLLLIGFASPGVSASFGNCYWDGSPPWCSGNYTCGRVPHWRLKIDGGSYGEH